MTMLVTGATGFVGGRIADCCAAAGHPVRAATRRPVNLPVSESIAVGDIGADTVWEPALAGVDTVIHAAAHVHRPDEPAHVAEQRHDTVNHHGTFRLARSALEAGVRRFVLISTVKVLGEETHGRPFDDAANPAPADAYARSKLQAERSLFQLARDAGFEAVALRPPLVYGPGVKANFRALLDLCAKPWPLPLGGLANRRSLIHVDNLADAALHAATAEGLAGRAFVVHDGAPVSTATLVATIRRAMQRAPGLLPVPSGLLRLGLTALGRRHLYQRLAGDLEVDDTGFRDATGWTPPCAFEDAIAQTVRWHRDVSSRTSA